MAALLSGLLGALGGPSNIIKSVGGFIGDVLTDVGRGRNFGRTLASAGGRAFKTLVGDDSEKRDNQLANLRPVMTPGMGGRTYAYARDIEDEKDRIRELQELKSQKDKIRELHDDYQIRKDKFLTRENELRKKLEDRRDPYLRVNDGGRNFYRATLGTQVSSPAGFSNTQPGSQYAVRMPVDKQEKAFREAIQKKTFERVPVETITNDKDAEIENLQKELADLEENLVKIRSKKEKRMKKRMPKTKSELMDAIMKIEPGLTKSDLKKYTRDDLLAEYKFLTK